MIIKIGKYQYLIDFDTINMIYLINNNLDKPKKNIVTIYVNDLHKKYGNLWTVHLRRIYQNKLNPKN